MNCLGTFEQNGVMAWQDDNFSRPFGARFYLKHATQGIASLSLGLGSIGPLARKFDISH